MNGAPEFVDRLLRFLDREEEDEARSSSELRSLPAEDRVLEGECVRGARLERVEDDGYVFQVGENLSKFRVGDAITVGDGLDFESAMPLVYGGFDADTGELRLEPDRFDRVKRPPLSPGAELVIDRRPLGLRGRLQDVVRAGFGDERIAKVLLGEFEPGRDEGRYQRALQALSASGLDESQARAGAEAIATDSLALVQGPPGTGKTRLLAEVLKQLCNKGARVALSAFTHRGVDNVLMALRRLDPSVPLCKVGNPGHGIADLKRAGVRIAKGRGMSLPDRGVVAGTPYGLARVSNRERFHLTVFDEAGQLPIPHAIAGMLLARHWLFFGDHRQLPPVVTATHADREATKSVFERLHDLYGGSMLDTSYRMNEGVCRVVGDTFYGGRLRSAEIAAGRRMPFNPGGSFDEVCDPDKAVVWARIDHLQPGMRSSEEANLCADLVAELCDRHGLKPADIALIAPFRAQVRAIRSALQKRGIGDEHEPVVDTVERLQGQEREVVIVSLAVGDPATLDQRSGFFFSTNRLNVALSRAKSKAVLVASRGAFAALPDDIDALRAASTFKRLSRGLPQVDFTSVYGLQS